MTNQNVLHKAIYEWFYNGDNALQSIFNIIGDYGDDGNAKNDAASVIFLPQTIGKSDVLQVYLDGADMLYTFMIQQYVPLATVKNKDVNLTAMAFFESVAQWVDENNTLPTFPEDCPIEKIKVLAGNIAGIDQNGAKLQISVQIYYTDKGE